MHANIFVAAALTSISAATGAISSKAMVIARTLADVSPGSVDISVLQDSFLSLVCLSGAIGGGIMSIAFFREDQDSRSVTAWKFIGSSFAGAYFTPGFLHYLGWNLTSDVVLTSSAVIGLVSWSVLRKIIPILPKLFAKRVKRQFGDDEPERDDRP